MILYQQYQNLIIVRDVFHLFDFNMNDVISFYTKYLFNVIEVFSRGGGRCCYVTES